MSRVFMAHATFSFNQVVEDRVWKTEALIYRRGGDIGKTYTGKEQGNTRYGRG
jgi:hypothetical protein